MMWYRDFLAWLSLALCVPSLAWAQSRVFRTSFTEAVNSRMTAIELGDFDGDEEGPGFCSVSPTGPTLDVAVTTENGELAILQNECNEAEVFFDPDTIAVGAFPAGMVQADFDEDTIPDFVIANANAGEVVFLKGRKDLDYFDFPSIPVDVGESPRGMAAADIDGDDHLDLVVANQGPDGAPGSVSVLKGDGEGGFTVVRQPDPTPAEPNRTAEALSSDEDTRKVAIGELNGDPELDILAINTRSNTMTIFIGNGDLTFQDGTTTPIGSAPEDVLLLDLNDDQELDLITADSIDDVVSVMLGNGDATFGDRRTFQAGTFPNGLALGDLDGDAELDLVVSNGRSGDVSILHGAGGGEFAPARTYVSDAEPRDVAVGNMDTDDHPDVLAIHAEAGTVAVLRNDGRDGLLAVEDVRIDSPPSSVAIADVDNDGLPDLVVASEAGFVVALRARAGGGFSTPRALQIGGRPRGIAAVDLNRDGRIDVAVADNAAGVVVAYGQRDGSFGGIVRIETAPQPAAITAGDFNRDGRFDLAVSALGTPGEISVLVQRADGTFAPAVGLEADDTPVGIGSGDTNGDGRDDIVVANTGSSTVAIFVSQADGTFRRSQTISPEVLSNGGPVSVSVADFDRDGSADFAVGLRIAGQGQPTVRVFEGQGDGTFTAVEPVQAGLIITSIVARDVTGDGFVDLGIVNETDNAVRVLCGSGAATFQSRQSDQVSRRPIFIGAGDFDADGRYDLATVNNDASSNNASVLTNCVGEADCINNSEPPSPCLGADLPRPTRGDANGDGAPSAADVVAVAAEVMDGDGRQIEDIGLSDAPVVETTGGVDANGDGRVDAQDAYAVAHRIFAGA